MLFSSTSLLARGDSVVTGGIWHLPNHPVPLIYVSSKYWWSRSSECGDRSKTRLFESGERIKCILWRNPGEPHIPGCPRCIIKGSRGTSASPLTSCFSLFCSLMWDISSYAAAARNLNNEIKKILRFSKSDPLSDSVMEINIKKNLSSTKKAPSWTHRGWMSARLP